MGLSGLFDQLVAFVIEDPRDGGRAGRQARSPHQYVADPLAAPVGVVLLEHEDGPSGDVRQLAALLALGLVHQAGGSFLLEPALPAVERVLAHADHLGEVTRRQAAAAPRVQDQQPLLRRHVRRRLVCRLGLGQPRTLAPPEGHLLHLQFLRLPQVGLLLAAGRSQILAQIHRLPALRNTPFIHVPAGCPRLRPCVRYGRGHGRHGRRRRRV